MKLDVSNPTGAFEVARHVIRRQPTPFIWQDPNTLPRRPWLYGKHLIRKHVSVTVAAGGVGKSSLSIVEALAMASERELLQEHCAKGLNIWIFNLEDTREELQLRITAAMLHHSVFPGDVQGRLYVDIGRERPLCTALVTSEGVSIVKPVMNGLAEDIEARNIDVLIVDPFVSSHQVGENDNGAIDMVAKEWALLADRCNCAIELVHHTRKTNGTDVSTEDGRGASALMATARSGRALNKMSDEMKAKAGVQSDPSTYFSVTRDKANLAPAGGRMWRRIVQDVLPNGEPVGVVELWHWPDAMDQISTKEIHSVQKAIDGRMPRYSEQTGAKWVGLIVADVLGLDAVADKRRIKSLIDAWLKSGVLAKKYVVDKNRKLRPCIDVGKWVVE